MTRYANTHLLSARLIAGGIKSFLPVRKRYTGTGGSDSARYCYGAWLRHAMAVASAVPTLRPQVVAEMGPGDSIGLGLAALLSGVRNYVALDVLAHTNAQANLQILDELARLIRARSDIPGEDEFPELYPRVSERHFPVEALSRLGLDPDAGTGRVDALRQAIVNSSEVNSGPGAIRYLCPWPSASVEPGSIDLVVSQAVLQDMDHWTAVDALSMAFRAMARWLKRGGAMSHQVNLAFPDTAHWNQHWAYGDLTWSLIRGRRPYYVNRVPASEYLRLCEVHGFEMKAIEPVIDHRGLKQDDLGRRFKSLPRSDYETRALHFVAVKK